MLNTCKDCVVVAYADVWDKRDRAERVGFTHMVEHAGMERKCPSHMRIKNSRFLLRKKGKTCVICDQVFRLARTR